MGTGRLMMDHVFFALAYASGPPPVQIDFQQTGPRLSQSQPFISYGVGLIG